ncbi:Gfo/Idh/MocA family oxidoreductase [Clostridium brassicae]|uniref:Inositol 2-dehydrogenase/D-chiro-inositol 3-dehydrogenase n=1 Tax=Clostridium brassicae TaxID=2999072 RepID=A0ABT4D9M6_9CLOT|nr:Gfo/Idh/MocA family oxidoreductase [Clostridium brassicae]MCY6959012.1 Gfo/Idh/MocA family oxidoreductase [Clostridium brassicae]
MDLRVGVIGTGAIGEDHIRRLTDVITGAKVVALSDINVENARRIADKYGAKFYSTGEEVINATEVDAIVIASWDETHAKYVIEAINAKKFVLCEKPLATSAEDCKKIVGAEIAGERQLVQVGFMRRFDRGYRQIKSVIENGKIGEPLMLHCIHRNRIPGPKHTTEMSIKNSVIHEIDVLRWLLDEDYKTTQVLMPKRSRLAEEGLHDPQIVLLETNSGIRIDIESFVNCQYGYDVKCEVVGETGTVRLPDPANVLMRSKGTNSYKIFPDWSDRFIEAYDIEFQEWINSVKKGIVKGPTSWDGYVACITADACTEAREKGTIVSINIPERPTFYNSTVDNK